MSEFSHPPLASGSLFMASPRSGKLSSGKSDLWPKTNVRHRREPRFAQRGKVAPVSSAQELAQRVQTLRATIYPLGAELLYNLAGKL